MKAHEGFRSSARQLPELWRRIPLKPAGCGIDLGRLRH
jgi:hypothetical protein